MQFIRELFSESGNISMVRFLSLICIINATLIALWGICKGADLAQVSILCATFLGTGMGAKVTQKYIEKS